MAQKMARDSISQLGGDLEESTLKVAYSDPQMNLLGLPILEDEPVASRYSFFGSMATLFSRNRMQSSCQISLSALY